MAQQPIPLEDLPGVSVVVRSYMRHGSLMQLLRALCVQDHPNFEVVIVEQSNFTHDERAAIDTLVHEDPRFRVYYSGPLGVSGARDAGWRLARHEIVLWIDDDDLPRDAQFVSGHARNYRDPNIVAVTGRHVYSPDEVCGYGSRWRARRYCLRYNFFGYPHVFCRFDERIESVDWVHGTNGSLRRAIIERVGGWETQHTYFDEHPFCLRLQPMLRCGERLVFDPAIRLLRRKHVPGGADARFQGSRHVFRIWFRYYHAVVMKHRPLRSRLIYPIFPIAAIFTAARWIWTDSMVHPSLWRRLADSLRTVTLGPFWYAAELRALKVGK